MRKLSQPLKPKQMEPLHQKCKLTEAEYWPQLVKTCVVSAFIENNLYPDLNPMIPVVMLDKETARVAVYNPLNDILMLSDRFFWQEEQQFNKSGLTLLLATIIHRYVTVT